MPPLKLSDSELTQIFRCAQPLPVGDRDAFLQAVAERLSGVVDVGPGAVFRVCAEVQKQFFNPPDIDFGSGRWSKYRG
jgi:hypothetical protein